MAAELGHHRCVAVDWRAVERRCGLFALCRRVAVLRAAEGGGGKTEEVEHQYGLAVEGTALRSSERNGMARGRKNVFYRLRYTDL